MVQRRAVRFIYGMYKRLDSPSSLIAANNITSLEQRRKIARLKFLYLLYNNKLCVDSSLYITSLSSRATRNHHQFSLQPIFARTNIFKFSYFPRTISDWNALPYNIFIAPNFNKALDDHPFQVLPLCSCVVNLFEHMLYKLFSPLIVSYESVSY